MGGRWEMNHGTTKPSFWSGGENIGAKYMI